MTIWILALLCVAIAGYVGFERGIVRTMIGLIGVLAGLICASMFGSALAPLMTKAVGNIFLAEAVSPLVVFILTVIVFGFIGQWVHGKVDRHFKYKETDSRLFHWERMTERCGAALGLLNGTVYFYVLCTIIYVAGYLSTQVSSASDAPFVTKVINRLATDINSTGLQNAVVALDPTPGAYYDAADVLGLLQRNNPLFDRLSRYPDVLSLEEAPDVQRATQSGDVQRASQSGSVREILVAPGVRELMANEVIVNSVKAIDMADLKVYMETGKSPKYQYLPILGRWDYDQELSYNQTLALKPGIKIREREALQSIFTFSFNNGTFTATPDGQAFIKASLPPELPAAGQQPAPYQPGPPERVLSGSWSGSGAAFTVNFPTPNPHPYYAGFQGQATVRVLGDLLYIEFGDAVIAFTGQP